MLSLVFWLYDKDDLNNDKTYSNMHVYIYIYIDTYGINMQYHRRNTIYIMMYIYIYMIYYRFWTCGFPNHWRMLMGPKDFANSVLGKALRRLWMVWVKHGQWYEVQGVGTPTYWLCFIWDPLAQGWRSMFGYPNFERPYVGFQNALPEFVVPLSKKRTT